MRVTNVHEEELITTDIMTQAQEAHLVHIKEEFVRSVDKKYRDGAAEHGGDIRDNTVIQLVGEALAECVDHYVYMSTIKSKLMAIALRKNEEGIGIESAEIIFGDLIDETHTLADNAPVGE